MGERRGKQTRKSRKLVGLATVVRLQLWDVIYGRLQVRRNLPEQQE